MLTAPTIHAYPAAAGSGLGRRVKPTALAAD